MTPPDQGFEKQKRRHGPMLYLMLGAILIFVIGSLMFFASPIGPEPEAEEPSTAAEE